MAIKHSRKALPELTSSYSPAITSERRPWRRIMAGISELANTTPPGPLH